MDQATIVTLTILGVLTLAILVFAGAVLQARSFTQLLELIRYLGSLQEVQKQVVQQVQTISSNGMEHGTSSAATTDTPTTQGNPD